MSAATLGAGSRGCRLRLAVNVMLHPPPPLTPPPTPPHHAAPRSKLIRWPTDSTLYDFHGTSGTATAQWHSPCAAQRTQRNMDNHMEYGQCD